MKFRPAILDRWQRSRHLKRHLGPYCLVGGPRLRISVEPGKWDQARLVRDARRLHVILGDDKNLSSEHRNYYLHALPVLVHVISRAASKIRIKAGLGDGSTDPSDQMAFSANHSTAILVPDPHFYYHSGYQLLRVNPTDERHWSERSSDIVWRGSSTGWDRGTRDPIDLSDPDCIQRVRVCALLKGEPGTDFKISSVVEPLNTETDIGILTQAGLFGEHVPEESWRDRQFALDIDGNANTFSNLFIRLLFGCCIIKIASPCNYRQWYYDRLKPWTHYVPARADLSDLRERIDWCRSHPEECRDIAAAGKALADTMTFETEMPDAVRRIDSWAGLRS